MAKKMNYYDKTEEQKKRTLQYRKRKILNGDNELLKTMLSIVEKNLKNYHADFFIHDVDLVKECEGEPFLWVVREYGTHFLYLHSEKFSKQGEWDNILYFNELLYNYKEFKGIYLHENGNLKKVSKEEAEKILKKYEEIMRNKLGLSA